MHVAPLISQTATDLLFLLYRVKCSMVWVFLKAPLLRAPVCGVNNNFAASQHQVAARQLWVNY